MLLLVDNSNRTTKLALTGPEQPCIDALCRIPSDTLSPATITAVLPAGITIDAILWASVTATGPAILDAYARSLGVPGRGLDGTNAPLDLRGCPEPHAIGPDRLANALAANARAAGRPAIAIDAGTAITFNVVDPGSPFPVFRGGAIAPGLAVFSNWLQAHTARLPEIPFPMPRNVPPAIGTTTVAAMSAAAWHGAAGMLRGILDAQCAGLGTEASIFLTGTDAPVVAAMLAPRGIEVVPPLTLDGLRLAAAFLLD